MRVDNTVIADLLGKTFRWGARGPDEFDCYGLVMEFYRRHNVTLPDVASPDARQSVAQAIEVMRPAFVEVDNRPGALVLLRMNGREHVGVALSHGTFIHASEYTGCVTVERFEPIWKKRIVGFYEAHCSAG